MVANGWDGLNLKGLDWIKWMGWKVVAFHVNVETLSVKYVENDSKERTISRFTN